MEFAYIQRMEYCLSGGLGWISRMPTTAQLYPDFKYVDLIQLNYYHNHPDYRRINMMTYKWDNTNYQLEPARNMKWEVRADIGYKGNRLSATYFRERMNNALMTSHTINHWHISYMIRQVSMVRL